MPQDIVMIHGAFCGGWAFDQFRKPFEAAGYRVHAPDLRHRAPQWRETGRLPAALATTSMLDYLDDVERVLERFAQPPILLGHSMGGLLAQMLAARGKAAAIVLLSPSPPAGLIPSSLHEIGAAQYLYTEGRYWEKAMLPIEEIISSLVLNCIDPAKHDQYLPKFVPESGRIAFEIYHWALDPQQATRVDARQVTCPVMTLAATQDRVNAAGTARQLAFRYRQRKNFKEYAGRGHWLHEEEGWPEIAEDILAWLRATL